MKRVLIDRNLKSLERRLPSLPIEELFTENEINRNINYSKEQEYIF